MTQPVELPTSKTPPVIMDLDVLKAEIQAQLPDAMELAGEAPADAAQYWLNLMGVKIGDDVTILPMALPGQQFGGKLVSITFGPLGPLVIYIRQTEDKPVNTIPWHGVQLFAKAIAPAVEVPQPTVDLSELEAFMRENNIEVPDEVSEFIHEEDAR